MILKRIAPFIITLFIWSCNFKTDNSFTGFKTINNTQLYCKVIGEGEPILIVHGGPGLNHEYFLPFLEHLSKKYKLIFYDQRSSGRSPIPADSNEITFTKFVDDIEGIRKEFGIEKVNLFSHSFGTKIALNYLLKYPEHVKSIIFSGAVLFSHEFDSLQNAREKEKTSHGYMDKRKIIVNSEGFKRGAIKNYDDLFKLSFQLSFYDTSKVNLLNLSLQDSLLAASKSLQQGLNIDLKKYDYDYYSILKKISIPALVIHGSADIIPLESDMKLKNSLGNAQLVIFEKSGHFPFIEENEKFIRVINNFVK